METVTPRKAQVLLSARQYELVEEFARQHGRSVSAVLREALEVTLLPTLERRRKEAALHRLTHQDLPTGDWEEIERELNQRWEACELS